jgi:hypothetical protein
VRDSTGAINIYGIKYEKSTYKYVNWEEARNRKNKKNCAISSFLGTVGNAI